MYPPRLHPLLQHSQHADETGYCCALLWDLREPPRSACHLSQHATNPPVSCLRVTCGIFPNEAWVAEARNWLGVTVRNVLDAIYVAVNAQITHPEWDALSPKQQNRVNIVFDTRWRRSTDPAQVREHGVLRADCLLQHILFAGLSNAPDSDDTCLLTLRRPKR
ncbi:ectomycorrhiza-regulated small secreted protein [Mycena sp. CBHHK59/15]|nr:ectomycorrhiza-regulated small secreted protein [Mycena sp. CBHHK59/15]